MSGVAVWFCFGADLPGPCRPGWPILERREDAAGQPQRPLRQGAVGRGGAAPSLATRLPSPAAPAASPSPPQRVGDRSAGGPGTWAPPSHPHSHPHTHPRARTRAPASRALSLADTQALRSPSRPARRAATPSAQPQGPPLASRCFSLDSSSAASVPATWARRFSRCCYCRDLEDPKGARWRHANGNDTLLLLRARF